MSLSHISILLEVVSFFLVTTDLYGEKRLTSLRDRLISFRHEKENKQYNDIVSMVAFGFCIIGLLFIFYILWIDNYTKDGLLWAIAGSIIVLAIFLFAYKFILISVTFFFFVIVRLILGLLISVIQPILKMVSLQGLLLFIGSLLFLIGKTINWVSP